jgi:uncharacterized membrane protein
MSLRLNAWAERVRSSLFFVPMLFVLLGGAAGAAMVEIDSSLEDQATNLPFILTSTVGSAREVLSVVAAATITVAGVAFSISLLVIQQASSQYSPRVVHSLFRDPFNRRILGLALGTFTYSLMVLRAVRSSLDQNGEPVIPNLSVALSVVLGVAALLGIIAFIDHNAHSMEVSQILHRVTRDTIERLDEEWSESDPPSDQPGNDPRGVGHTVLLQESGWIQQVSRERLLALVPDGGTVRLETRAGRYAVAGTPLCTLWPAPEDPDQVAADSRTSIAVGPARTMQQDPSYGIRQLADVALVALSPGVNDPTTAQDAIFHLTDVLRVVLARDAAREVECDDRGRRLIHAHRHTHTDLVRLAFDEIRRASSAHPAVCVYLLEALHLLAQSLPSGAESHGDELRRQAELVVAGAEASDLLVADLDEVRRIHLRLFVAAPGPASVRS